MNDLINNSDPQAMKDISKKIAVYANNLKADMKKLAQAHQGMHSCWSGKQYDDFSNAIADANSTIAKQADKLLIISNDVEKDAEQLAIAMGISLR